MDKDEIWFPMCFNVENLWSFNEENLQQKTKLSE